MTPHETQSYEIQPHGDELWLAFAYVAGELAEAEAAEFEYRLAESESLQQAVMDATRLVLCVQQGDKVPVKPERVAVHSQQGWWAIAAALACSCVLAVGLMSLGGANRGSDDLALAEFEDVETEESLLTNLWATADEAEQMHEASASGQDWDAGALEFEGDADEGLDVPDWLLVAVLQDSSTASEAGAAVETTN